MGLLSIFKKKPEEPKLDIGWSYHEHKAQDVEISNIIDLYDQYKIHSKKDSIVANESLKKRLVIAEYLVAMINNEIDEKIISIDIKSGVITGRDISYAQVRITFPYGDNDGQKTHELSVSHKQIHEFRLELQWLFRFIDEMKKADDVKPPKKKAVKKKAVKKKATAKKKAPPKKKT